MFTQRLYETAGEGTSAGGGAAAFDPAAFKADLLAELRKDLNGITKSLKTDLTKAIKDAMPVKTVEGIGDGSGTGAGTGNGAGAGTGTGEGSGAGQGAGTPEMNAKVLSLERTVNELKAAKAESDKAATEEKAARIESDRRSAIKDAMSTLPWKDDHSRSMFEKAIAGDIIRNDDGELIAHTEKGDIPYTDYIKNTAEATPGLLAARGTGGAGAKGAGASGGHGWVPRTTDDWSKYTPEQKKIAESHVLAMMAEAQGVPQQ